MTKKKRLSFPRTAVASEWPESEECIYVCRLANPLIVALVQPVGDGNSLHLHAWPPEVESAISPVKLTRCLARMAACYGAQVENIGHRVPKEWSYDFGMLREVPDHLFLDNHEAGFTGILRTAQPRCLLEARQNEGNGEVCILRWYDDPQLESIVSTVAQAAVRYLDEFTGREDKFYEID
ncbi:MAG: hypothetical protein LBV12_07140 [Puniceicoccales bacterium]|jgi:hypothetical protein|nr:hypothetical protein [Puniceicoccales bacterium]